LGLRAIEFLDRFKSRSDVFCRKVILAMWKDFTRKLKTSTKGNKQSRGNKTWLKYYEEKFDDYFAKLKMEIDIAARIKGSEWEWEGILLLEKICNADKVMDLEANVSEGDKSDIEEFFQVKSNSFLARFNFQGRGETHNILKDLIIQSGLQSHYDLSLQGWDLSYEEVSMALWKKIEEEYGSIACEENGFELGHEHDPMDVVSAFFKQIGGEIDKIFMSEHGTKEWEQSGMIYFMTLCGRKIAPTMLSDAETSSDPNFVDNLPEPHLKLNNNDPVLESIVSECTDSLESFQQEHDTEQDALYLEDEEPRNAEDESEEEGSMFFEIFESVAENFFAQIKNTRCNYDFGFVIGSLWERAMHHNFRETDLSALDSLTVEDQCRLIAEFFEELEEEMNMLYNPKSWSRQDALLSFAGQLYEELCGDTGMELRSGSMAELNSNEPEENHNETDKGIQTVPAPELNAHELSESRPEPEPNTLYMLGPEMESCFSHECSRCFDNGAVRPKFNLTLPADERILLGNLSKFEEDEVTATTADESWDESGSITSDFESVTDTQPSCITINTGSIIGGQETRKEGERRLLRQHRESYRGPKKNKKHFCRSNHQARLDIIHEAVGEEIREEVPCTTQREVRFAPTAGTELKEDIVNAMSMKTMQIMRKKTRKRSWYQPQNKRRIKKPSNSCSRIKFVRQMVKWWAITTSIQSYTCAANRYAKMRSNRRFKPGD